MKKTLRFSSIMQVLAVAGLLNGVWAYYAHGISGLRTRSVVWVVASVAAILAQFVLRRSSEGQTHGEGQRYPEARNVRRVGWTVFGVGAVATAVAFGLGKATSGVMIAVLTVSALLLYVRLATHSGPTHRQESGKQL